MEENADKDPMKERYEHADQGKATMLAMIIVVTIRKRLADQGVELTTADMDDLLHREDVVDRSLSILPALDAMGRVPGGAGATAMTRMLATSDPAGTPFELHDEPAESDANTLAAGIVARMKAAAFHSDEALEREMMRVEQEQDPTYMRDVLYDAIGTIRVVLGIQKGMEQQGRMQAPKPSDDEED
ncbi:hypothetical protein [Bifidobacterium saguinibicoloris]|uniref:hypothetical protein n=1 Tax=Bifidobacterium saguinibicoloris TaxID=2834433 RepID=UPI001C58ED3D|nr:hypothetical protein [Bifidobacterium saguinibicoloris]MBW3080147.1 hypothetical protein [Bifidobacterium saguinibicoloris]